MLKYFSLSVLLSLSSSAPSMALLGGWSMDCTVNKTKSSFDEAQKSGEISDQLRTCIGNKEKAEGNPNSTNAFLERCQRNPDGLKPKLKSLCAKAEGYAPKENKLSSLTKTASQVVPKGWDIECTAPGVKGSYETTHSTDALSKKLTYCIGNQKIAEANPNATNAFLNLCKTKKPEEGSKLEDLCKKASTYETKESIASMVTKKASQELNKSEERKKKTQDSDDESGETSTKEVDTSKSGSEGDSGEE